MQAESKLPDLLPILERLGNAKHLERKRASSLWIESLKLFPSGELPFSALEQRLLSMFESSSWEERYGAVFASSHLLCTVDNAAFQSLFVETLKRLMTDDEFRLRAATGDALELLIQKQGIAVYESIKEHLASLLEKYASAAEGAAEESKTVAWRYLESSLLILQRCVEGAGAKFLPYLSESIVSCVEKAAKHSVSHIREISINLSKTFLSTSGEKGLSLLGSRLAPIVLGGMTDIWPQLRYAGCSSARTILALIGDSDELKKVYYPILLPAICLNRYYNVEGVRTLALQAWKDTVGDKGKEYVLEYIDKFIEHYIGQTKSGNFLVREAACHCICEIYTKVAALNKEKVRPFIPKLLETLIVVMQDLSWEVRAAACLAGAKLVVVALSVTDVGVSCRKRAAIRSTG
eukprot:TRINITY_DN12466_c0_g1_i8.p1 TRINITY_DN12466_c0_g1~~TRINITY_DN12466_c0_g1_i8.p1  ORF type:complete len:406 (+),score=85.42 TRINITY_DN12466_c0_g1_i8:162-1379(+)